MVSVSYVDNDSLSLENDGSIFMICDENGNIYASPYEEDGEDCIEIGQYIVGEGVNYALKKLEDYENGKSVNFNDVERFVRNNYRCEVFEPSEYNLFFVQFDESDEEYLENMYEFIKDNGSYVPFAFDYPSIPYVYFDGTADEFVEAAREDMGY